MSTERVESLIGELTGDLKPVRRLAHPLLRMLPWVALAAAYVAGIVAFLGLRGDWSQVLTNHYFVFEIGLAFAIAATAALASGWMSIPDMRGKSWLKAVPLTLFSIFVFWSVCRGCLEGVHMPYLGLDHCFTDALLFGALPAGAIIFLCKRGATCQPNWMATMNVLAISMMGWIGLRFTCAVDDIGHAFIYHFAPFAIFAVLMTMCAKGLFRW